MRCIKLILWGLLISSALLNAQNDITVYKFVDHYFNTYKQ